MKRHLNKALLGFYLTIEGLLEALAVHQADGEHCPCDRCHDARGLLFQLTHAESILECAMRRPSRKLRRLRAAGFPPAAVIAELITAWQQRQQLGTGPTQGPVALATGPA